MLHITYLFKRNLLTKFVCQYHSGASESNENLLFVDMMEFLIVKSTFDILPPKIYHHFCLSYTLKIHVEVFTITINFMLF